jgi:hypothetical protein
MKRSSPQIITRSASHDAGTQLPIRVKMESAYPGTTLVEILRIGRRPPKLVAELIPSLHPFLI